MSPSITHFHQFTTITAGAVPEGVAKALRPICMIIEFGRNAELGACEPTGLESHRVAAAIDQLLRVSDGVTHATAQGNARIASSSKSSAE